MWWAGRNMYFWHIHISIHAEAIFFIFLLLLLPEYLFRELMSTKPMVPLSKTLCVRL